MDDIYDNLDNYEDLNIVEELKNENRELKSKLGEYAVAMDKLQKDFDRLSTDFKNLEKNYSSLMKTAKVEVERKTKIINDLNVEKDMIVLKAFQNRHNLRSLRDITKPFQKGPMNDVNLQKVKNMISSPADNPKPKPDVGRKEESRFSSVDTVTSSNPDITGRLLKLSCGKAESTELWSDRTSDTKENMVKKAVEDVQANRAVSIRNRRKSMPAARPHDKFSSDEECEEDYCRNETYKKGFPTREENKPNPDRVYNERYRHRALDERNKASETSSMDDRLSGFDAGRDTYHRNRIDRYGPDKYRRDRYENTQRNRRHFSPDRSRGPRRPEDCYQRQDYGRHRVLESPPPDKLNHYQQRNRDVRSKRQRDDQYDYERRGRYQEHFSSKHKTVTDLYDEPISKRQRTTSFSKYSEEEKKWPGERVPLEKTVSDLMAEMPEYTSCQSPDYSLTDSIPHHTIREIKHTASVPLDDPRNHSKKYTEKTAVTGINVDLKMVDTSKWDLKGMMVDVSKCDGVEKQLELPKALTRRPSQCSEDIVKDIYMDIENPVSNMSTESGEIFSFADDERDFRGFNKSQLHHHPEVYHQVVEDEQIDKLKDRNFASDNLGKSTNKIPKNINEGPFCQDSVASNVPSRNTIDENKPSPCELNKDKIMKSQDECDANKVLSKDKERNSLPSFLNKDSKNQKAQIARSDSQNKEHSFPKCDEKYNVPEAVKKQIVAGDLELSDETSDNMEIQRKSVIEKTKTMKKGDVEVKDSSSKNSKYTVNNKKSEKPRPEPELLPERKSAEIDCKKQRSKSHKGKMTKVKEAVATNDPAQVSNKKPKPKRDKKDTTEIKTKFTELFGDSSSLITPEDLGIMALQAQQQPVAKYVPICEDAQDAVSLKITEVAKVAGSCLHQSTVSETEASREVVEIGADKSECKSVTQPKHTNETKSRNSTKKDEKARESEVVSKLVIDVSVKENPVIISPIEAQVPVSDTNEGDIRHKDLDSVKVTKNELLRPIGLVQALATSTPQKGFQPGSPEVEKVVDVAGPSRTASFAESVDPTADQSSANGSVGAQNDADVPDVRIFVKRRRRVVKKP